MPDRDRHLAAPARPCGTGVLVLAGSSGRIDVDRAELLAAHGATALAIRWFGGRGQPSTACELPLEMFTSALDELASDCNRLSVVGLSYGAEAALLTAARESRVTATVALAPSHVAWEGPADDDTAPPRSKWTWGGEPVPFVPLDRSWVPQEPTPWFRPLYEQSLRAASVEVRETAAIPVERIRGELVLVAGGDDLVWPSHRSAEAIAARRRRAGLSTTVVADGTAGHQVVLPGEPRAPEKRPYLVGGDDESAVRLGAAAWPVARSALGLHAQPASRTRW